ncbi:glycosyltransferase family 2 protein [Ruminococcus bovis]|uniref:Glycosyltransferase family 2 protein n=1 Tax=Ruminococcus bovis TaxID=2564099 RepID=A0A4P8XV60_9FIRM|nr:glycosyltransferase family 2 protein [Ruminococcus bovis]QCT06956.1 glycosyltransferase family 2 protein [Ruminococcus bovis]
MKVSFIIPVYNAEKYLERCVESVLNLTGIDFELILVDDGSKDNSWNIIENYMVKDKRIRGISIENQGVSNARNTGIDMANGEVIIFVDADDYFNDKADSVLRSVLKDYDSRKLCFFNYNCFNDDGSSWVYHYPTITNTDLKLDITNLFVLNQSVNSCWCKVFSTDVIKSNNLRFDKSMKVGEDACFVMEYLMCVDDFEYIDEPIYNYYINSLGAMKSAKISTIMDEVKVYNTRIKLINHYNLHINEKQNIELHNEYFKSFLGYTKRFDRTKGFSELYSDIKRYYKEPAVVDILKNCSKQGLSKKQEIMLQIIKHKCYLLFSLLCKI